MKIKRLLSLVLALVLVLSWVPMRANAADGIAVDETNFPDANFRAYILGQDYGADGALTQDELTQVTTLSVSYLGIQDLTGIEYFTALTNLYCVHGHLTQTGLTNLDISRNTKLERLDCSGNDLTRLDVSNNPELWYLYCGSNQLTDLDVSQNTTLTDLNCSGNQLTELDISQNTLLEDLYCGGNQLTDLDVSQNTTLTDLNCSGNQLTELDISQNTLLEYLACESNQLISLDISNNPALKSLRCGSNQLTTLDVSHNTALRVLNCGSNQLITLDVDGYAALTDLSCGNNQITELNVSGCTALEELYLSGNPLISLDVSGCTALEELSCYSDQLTDVDVSGCTALRELTLQNGQLTSLDVSQNTALTDLNCSGNQLTELDVSQNTALTDLNCSDNQLTELDVSQNTVLTDLNCSDNQLTELDVSQNTVLTDLYCGYNQLTSLDVHNNMALMSLACGSNQLASLNVSNNTALTRLNCGSNQLTSLDVSKNTALTSLDCNTNQLTSLDVGKHMVLEYLWCGGNQLASLDIRNNTKLHQLDCNSNRITSLDISQNPTLRSLECYSNLLTNLDVSKNEALGYLDCSSNQLTSLDIRNNTELYHLDCSENQLTNLDISKSTKPLYLSLACDSNRYEIVLDKNNQFDLSTLPGSFNVTNAYNWVGGTVNGTILTVDSGSTSVTYTYHLGWGMTDQGGWIKTETFTLICKTHAHTEGQKKIENRVEPTCAKAGSYDEVVYCTVCGEEMSRTAVTLDKLPHEYKDGMCVNCGVLDPNHGEPTAEVDRVSGSNRFETATLVADQMKEALGVEKFDAVILANGYNFADALAGSYLAAQKNAPILLTWNGADKYAYLNDATIQYVKENLQDGGTVYILGGTSAVPASIDAALTGYNVKRMDGATRFETNLMILEEAGVKAGDEVLVCTSTNFADSLSASAAGKPILLVWNEGGKLFDSQKDFLAGLNGNTFCVVGGESAVSKKLEDVFKAYGTTTRLAGANRFETSVLVAEKYFPEASSAVLAYAWDFPDGLCGGALAYSVDAPLILTMTKYESQAAEYIQGQGIKTGVVLGGEGLISEESVQKIFGN